MAEFISAPLALAAEQFAKLPGIGIKTAQRLAYYMLNLPPHEVKEFADALVRARNGVQLCSCCQNFTGGYEGVYHVLHGLLSPMDGVSAEDLKIKELMARLTDVREVIMATNPTVEGEATAVYISRLIKPMGIKVSRLAYGLPAGSALEFADDVTLMKALENRSVL